MGVPSTRELLRTESGHAVSQLCAQMESRWRQQAGYSVIGERGPMFHVIHELLGFDSAVLDVNTLSITPVRLSSIVYSRNMDRKWL